MQQGVDVSHAGPVPTGNTGQHLGQAAGMVLPAVETVVPQQLLVGSLQPAGGNGGETVSVGQRFVFSGRLNFGLVGKATSGGGVACCSLRLHSPRFSPEI